ncbi:C2H2-type domain-containing protein [Aphelenchoides besseyi]|nr:C2H2-type domain-containing protein [Aphelenchoides besseyi]
MSSNLNPRSGFTCVTCRLVFANGDLQRKHYSSEWHRYNAKRQVAELPPISEQQFESKVKSYHEAEATVQKDREPEKSYCKECKKVFQSKNAFENHLNSKKHKQNVESAANAPTTETEDVKTPTTPVVDRANLEEMRGFRHETNGSDNSEWETVNSSDTDDDEYDHSTAIPETSCFFCSSSSENVEDNLIHMSSAHGFFIPDANYCANIPGLLRYLGEKVGCGNYCIQCKNKRFRNVQSCQLHMRDKAHCTFSIEGDRVVEYLDFYDYGELLKDEEEADDEVAVDTGFTLVLPSGAQLGHRSLLRYYKQKLRPAEDVERLERSRQMQKLQQSKLKALGWTGSTGTAAVQRARDFKFMKAVISKDRHRRELHSNKLFKSKGRDDQM